MNFKILSVAMLLLITGTAIGQRDMNRKKAMKERLEVEKIAYITTQLDLTSEEAEKFWPVYNAYQDRLEDLRAENRPEKKSWDDLTDADAEKLIADRIHYEKEELALREDFIAEMKGVISAKRVAKLLWVEREFKNKMIKKLKDRLGKVKERS